MRGKVHGPGVPLALSVLFAGLVLSSASVDAREADLSERDLDGAR